MGLMTAGAYGGLRVACLQLMIVPRMNVGLDISPVAVRAYVNYFLFVFNLRYDFAL
jgi:hypothetical protein